MTDLTRLSEYSAGRGSLIRGLILIVVAALALVTPLAVNPATPTAIAAGTPRISADYRSFFADSALDGTGWTTCPTAITFSIDPRALRPDQRTREIKRVRWSMRQWAQAADVPVRFTGRERLRLNPTSHTLHPADGSALRDRHVYISFLREGVDPLMVDPVAGLAMPARVNVADREVIGGVALFRARHVRSLSKIDGRALRGLYLHELGHVFGLGHAQRPENVMHPTVVQRTKLGAGDIRGVRAVVKPCLV